MAAVLLPEGRQAFFTTTGVPAVGYKLMTWAAGTSTPQTTWADALKIGANPNPIILDARGEAVIFWDGAYKIQLLDPTGAPVWPPVDNVQSQQNTFSVTVTPTVTNSIDLGSPALSWRSGYFATNLYLGPNQTPVFDPVSGNIGSYARTAAEISAGVTPTNFGYPPLCLERYGANPTGAVECSAAFNTAFAVGLADGNCQVFSWAGGTYKVSAALTIYLDHVGFDGRGCKINAAGLTAGFLFNPKNDTADPLQRPGLNKSHPLENFTALGPGNAVSAGFILFNDSSGVNVIAGCVVRNGASFNWQTHVFYQVGAYFESFQNWCFDSDSGGLTSGTMIQMPGAVQSGERNSFINCRFGIAQVSCINQADGNADTHFIDCSFNGSKNFLTQTGGNTSLTDCHIESAQDTAYWFNIAGANSVLNMRGGVIIMDAIKSAFSVFYCDGTVTAGGISLRDVQFNDSLAYSLPLVAGTGPVFVDNLTSFAAGIQPYYMASSLNVIADSGFESTVFTRDGWVTSGTTPPTIANTNPHSGAVSAKFAGIVGQSNAIQLTKPCRPGQLFSGQAWMAVTGWATGANGLQGTIFYTAADGTSISGQTFAAIAATAAYALFPIRTFVRAPAGTANVILTFSMSGVASGTPFGYVDDVILNVN